MLDKATVAEIAHFEGGYPNMMSSYGGLHKRMGSKLILFIYIRLIVKLYYRSGLTLYIVISAQFTFEMCVVA